jgi:hypothetical protein
MDLNWLEISEEFQALSSNIKVEIKLDAGVAAVVSSEITYDNRDKLVVLIRLENDEGYFEDRLDMLTSLDADKIKQAKFNRLKACIFSSQGLSTNTNIVEAVQLLKGKNVAFKTEKRSYINKNGHEVEIRSLRSLETVRDNKPASNDVCF